MRKKLTIGVIIVFLLFAFSVSAQLTHSNTNPHTLVYTVPQKSIRGTTLDLIKSGKLLTKNAANPPTGLTTHNPIQILSNTAFTTTPGVVSGNGSITTPYIISGWNITNTVGGSFCIEIENTNKVVYIENNYLNDLDFTNGFGFYLYNATNVYFFNNYIENSYSSIYGEQVYNGLLKQGDVIGENAIFNNTIISLSVGMNIINLPSVSISNNNIFATTGNASTGIQVTGSNNANVDNNSINSASLGILSTGNYPISIYYNNIYNSSTGIHTELDWESDIEWNNITLSGTGIFQDNDNIGILALNFINDTGTAIDLSQSTKSNISSNIIPYSIYYGIYTSLSDGNIINGNFISNAGSVGIYVSSASGDYIFKNKIIDFIANGLEFDNVFNETAIHNTISGSSTSIIGLLLTSGEFDQFYQNTIENSSLLLKMTQSTWNNVSYNIFQNTYGNGSLISHSLYNTIGYNSFADGSAFFNLIMSHGANNRVIGNKFTDSWYYDLYLEGDSNTTVERNAFLNPSHFDGSQALDSGVFNEFLYNYWAGWNAPDVNNDGLVDNPFPIDGYAHSYDYKPLVSISEIYLFPVFTVPRIISTNTTITVSVNGSLTTVTVNGAVTTGNSTSSITSKNKSSPGFTTITIFSGLLILTGVVLLRRRK